MCRGPAVALPLLLPTVLRLRCGDGLRAWALRRRGAIASRQAQCTSNSSTSVSTATALGHHHWAHALRRCAARKLPVQCVTSASMRSRGPYEYMYGVILEQCPGSESLQNYMFLSTTWRLPAPARSVLTEPAVGRLAGPGPP